MNLSTYRFALDIHKTGSQVLLQTKRASTGRRLLISLTEGFMPYTITERCYAVFRARKPDGTIVFNDCVIDGNVIIYDVTLQTVAAAGMLECEITLYAVDGTQITSPHFSILVEETTQADGEIESSSEFGALTDIIGKLGNIDYLIKKKAQEAVEAAIQNGGIVPGEGIISNCSKRIVDIELLAEKWVGEASPYAQVIEIDGTTENTQVTLTLDSDQYMTFYEKDIAFVTENVDGVITVYSIGQKLQNDYTIQAIVEEVYYE